MNPHTTAFEIDHAPELFLGPVTVGTGTRSCRDSMSLKLTKRASPDFIGIEQAVRTVLFQFLSAERGSAIGDSVKQRAHRHILLVSTTRGAHV